MQRQKDKYRDRKKTTYIHINIQRKKEIYREKAKRETE